MDRRFLALVACVFALTFAVVWSATGRPQPLPEPVAPLPAPVHAGNPNAASPLTVATRVEGAETGPATGVSPAAQAPVDPAATPAPIEQAPPPPPPPAPDISPCRLSSPPPACSAGASDADRSQVSAPLS